MPTYKTMFSTHSSVSFSYGLVCDKPSVMITKVADVGTDELNVFVDGKLIHVNWVGGDVELRPAFINGVWFVADDRKDIFKSSDGIIFSHCSNISKLTDEFFSAEISDFRYVGERLTAILYAGGSIIRQAGHTIDPLESFDHGVTWNIVDKFNLQYSADRVVFKLKGKRFIRLGNMLYQEHDTGEVTHIKNLSVNKKFQAYVIGEEKVIFLYAPYYISTVDGETYTEERLIDSETDFIFIGQYNNNEVWIQPDKRNGMLRYGKEVWRLTIEGLDTYALAVDYQSDINLYSVGDDMCVLYSEEDKFYCLATIDHATKSIIPI